VMEQRVVQNQRLKEFRCLKELVFEQVVELLEDLLEWPMVEQLERNLGWELNLEMEQRVAQNLRLLAFRCWRELVFELVVELLVELLEWPMVEQLEHNLD